MYFISFILFSSICVNIVAGDCPSGWGGQWKHKCYWSGGRNNFEGNKQICIEKNAELVSIENEDENAAILRFLQSQRIRGDHWVSAKRVRLGVNEFKWGDGRMLTYSKWHSGEPSEIHKESAACVIIGSIGTWWDVPCEERRSVLCQLDLNKQMNQFNFTDYILDTTVHLSSKVDNNTYTIQALQNHLKLLSQTVRINITRTAQELRSELMNEISRETSIAIGKLNKFMSQQLENQSVAEKQVSSASIEIVNIFSIIMCSCAMIILGF